MDSPIPLKGRPDQVTREGRPNEKGTGEEGVLSDVVSKLFILFRFSVFLGVCQFFEIYQTFVHLFYVHLYTML